MNRTNRLLAIVLELQAHGRRRAVDLAATFETSTRTIYRDIQALCEAGVPVVAAPGQGYTLQPGYFLPPLSFSADEATLILLGLGAVAPQFDAQYRTAAEAAGLKITAVLPPERQADVRALQAAIGFITLDAAAGPAALNRLRRLRRAVLDRTRVRFTYYARLGAPYDETPAGAGRPRERQVDPYAVVNVAGAWYLVGYCHERRAPCRFRLDRIDDRALLPGSSPGRPPSESARRTGRTTDR